MFTTDSKSGMNSEC